MKLASLFVVTALVGGSVAHAEGAKWLTSWSEATKQAKKQKKPIMALFTGSDWCPWCVKLESEVFSTPKFVSWSKNVVLLKLDFPKQHPQAAWEANQNKGLSKRFSVSGFPSVLMMRWDGKEVMRGGYAPGGAAEWINKLVNEFNDKIAKK